MTNDDYNGFTNGGFTNGGFISNPSTSISSGSKLGPGPSTTPRNPHIPPSDPDFECKEFSAAEGTYILSQDIFNDALQPVYTVGTTASLVSIKYKEYTGHPNTSSKSTSSSGDNVSAIDRVGEQLHPDSDDDVATTTTTSVTALSSPNSTTTSNTLFSGSSGAAGVGGGGGGQRPSYITTTSTTPSASEFLNPLASPKILNTIPPVLSIEGKPGDSGGSGEGAFSALFNRSKQPKKPKNNLAKTNSSFVQKIMTNDNLAKILSQRTSEDTYLFYNVGKCFVWMDATSKPKEPLSRIFFAKAYPTSHDVNLLTRGCDHLDVIIGFSSGDCIWFDPLCNKYYRLNKGGIMNSSAVTMIKWVPGSENTFMAAYQDGSIMVFDKERDDQAFSPMPAVDGEMFHVTRPQKNNKHNPVSHWQVSKKAITAFAFSPDCQHVAVVGVDGLLRVIDFTKEMLYDTYGSYFGGLNCVAWSPDGRYILTGGQDDLVTIWAFREQKIVARCQGHQSWVTGVAFDPWRCDEKVYRFASLAEDAKLILWDFSVNALHRPKGTTHHRRSSFTPSVMDSNGAVPHELRRQTSLFSLSQDSSRRPPMSHPVLPKSHVAILQPSTVCTIHPDPTVGVTFREDSIVTTDRRGRVRVWGRPAEMRAVHTYVYARATDCDAWT